MGKPMCGANTGEPPYFVLLWKRDIIRQIGGVKKNDLMPNPSLLGP